MKTSRFGRLGPVMAAAFSALLPVLCAQSANAQILGGGRPERPNRALFGGRSGDIGQQLLLSADLGVGKNRTRRPDEVGGFISENPGFGSGALRVDYGLNLPRFTVTVGAGSSARYAPAVRQTPVVHNQARAGISSNFQPTRRTTVNVDAGVSYQPVSVLVLFPGMFEQNGGPLSLGPDYEFDLPTEHYLTTSGTVGLMQAVSRRSSLSLNYGYGLSGSADVLSQRSYNTVTGRYSHQLAEGLSMRLGYGRSFGQFEPTGANLSDRVETHNIDVGVDFDRQLSFSRRTSLAFSTGSTAISNGISTRWDIVGDASLTHEMGRTWRAVAAYSRQVGFLGVLAEPTFSDSLSATVSGLISRRVTLQTGVGASIGEVGLTSNATAYRAYQAFASLQTALTRMTGVSLSYINYRYRFDSPVSLPAVVAADTRRQTVQVAFNLALPILQRVRRSNAAR